jgi:proline racemase
MQDSLESMTAAGPNRGDRLLTDFTLPPMEIVTTDYHTAGEPFRIVAEGAVEIPGSTVRERRERAAATEEVDRVRRLLCHEPRGHADMYGCFLVPPDDSGADLGALFWHKDGYSTACGHGAIALGTWAVESGRIAAPPDGEVDISIDVPSGRVVARVRCRGGAVEVVTFRNVPSFVVARGVPVCGTEVDVAYGGAMYAFVSADSLGVRVDPAELPELIRIGRAIKDALEGHEVARHPSDDRLSGIYGTVVHEQIAPLHLRNVAIFADGEVDRSPTGSATSARTALLLDAGALSLGQTWRNDSIIGTTFYARAIGTTDDGALTEVDGIAFRTGEHRFVIEDRDPLATGFVLR